MTTWDVKKLGPPARANSYLANGLCRLAHHLDLEALAHRIRQG